MFSCLFFCFIIIFDYICTTMLNQHLKPIKYKLQEESSKQQGQILFEPKQHTYTNITNNVKYTSVSQLISKFKPIPKLSTKSTEDRLILTKEEVLYLWKNINKVAINRGSYIHYIIEQFIINNRDRSYTLNLIKEQNPNLLFNEIKELMKYVIYVDNILNEHKGCIFHPERILYNNRYLISGQTDLLIEHDVYISIYD